MNLMYLGNFLGETPFHSSYLSAAEQGTSSNIACKYKGGEQVVEALEHGMTVLSQ